MNNKFSWIHAFTDADLPSTTKLVLHTICMFMNTRGEGAFPAIETIAEKSGLGITAVKKHIALGEESGWLTKGKHGFGGRGWARNEYHVAYPEHLENEENNVGRETAHHVNKVGHLSQEGGTPGDLGVGREVSTNIPINKPININTPKSPNQDLEEESVFEKQFEQIWNTYPNQQDKPQALAAYQGARIKASHEWIYAGVRHYTRNCEKNRQSPKLLKNWFGNEGWRDITEPPKMGTGGDSGSSTLGEDVSPECWQRWLDVLAAMVVRMGQPTVSSWFSDLALGEGPDNALTLIAKSKFVKARIQSEYFYALEDAFSRAGGGVLKLMLLDEFMKLKEGDK